MVTFLGNFVIILLFLVAIAEAVTLGWVAYHAVVEIRDIFHIRKCQKEGIKYRKNLLNS